MMRKILSALAIAASLYHLYLVFHPYTPLSYELRAGVLDLTQLVRATHAWFVIAVGYLTSFTEAWKHSPGRARAYAGYAAIGLSIVPTALLIQRIYTDLASTALVVVAWTASMAAPAMAVPWPRGARFLDLAPPALSVLPYAYMVADYDNLIYRAVSPLTLDLAMGWSEVLMLLGLVMRLVGPEMPVLVLAFMLYNIYGPLFPPPWNHPGFGVDFLVGKIYIETEAALFGTVAAVSVKYIVYFVMLSGVLSALGFGDAMARTFLSLMGRRPHGVGRAAVAMGVGMGMVSGSGAADTAFISSSLKDLFRRSGYPDLVAAGIAANAGTLAIITPPVMGSVAFVMAEVLGIPYTWIMVMAIVPAALYAISIAVYNELYARAAGLSRIEIPGGGKGRLKPHVFVPIAFIVAMIAAGFSIALSVSLAMAVAALVAALDRDLRPSPRKILRGLDEGFRGMPPIGASIITANLIMAMVVVSGLHQKFSLALQALVGHSLAAAIAFAAGFSLLLGMGVPPLATYVLSSVLTAPTIIGLAVGSGIPEEAAVLGTHMFLFYMAMLADVTPPVALSAFAASSVFGTDPVKIGVKAAMVALPKYLYGPSFIYSYWGLSLLVLPIAMTAPAGPAAALIASRIAAAAAGTALLSVANAGFLLRRLSPAERIVAGAAGAALIIPNEVLNAAGLLAGLAAAALGTLLRRADQRPVG